MKCQQSAENCHPARLRLARTTPFTQPIKLRTRNGCREGSILSARILPLDPSVQDIAGADDAQGRAIQGVELLINAQIQLRCQCAKRSGQNGEMDIFVAFHTKAVARQRVPRSRGPMLPREEVEFHSSMFAPDKDRSQARSKRVNARDLLDPIDELREADRVSELVGDTKKKASFRFQDSCSLSEKLVISREIVDHPGADGSIERSFWQGHGFDITNLVGPGIRNPPCSRLLGAMLNHRRRSINTNPGVAHFGKLAGHESRPATQIQHTRSAR